MKNYIYIFSVIILLSGCKNNGTQAPKIDILWKLEQNMANESGESKSMLTLSNNSETDLSAKGWSIYFNNTSGLRTDALSVVDIVTLNGDLKVLKPNSKFLGLKSGNSTDIAIYSNSSILSFTDAPIGFYLVLDADSAVAFPCNLSLATLPDSGLNRSSWEQMPVYTPEVAYEENLGLNLLKKGEFCPIIPTPKQFQYTTGELLLTKSISIHCDEIFSNEANFLKAKLATLFTGQILINQSVNGDIVLSKTNNVKANAEAYSLSVSDSGIKISAANAKGAFYGIQTLLALFPVNAWKQPADTLTMDCVAINDEPRFEYRGMHLDVARNFQPKANVLRFLDAMAFYKLNKFHFHICDDEGWRVEISGLPELTEYGAFRGHSKNESACLQPSFGSGSDASPALSHGSGFYTRTDFIEILKYATERHIEVIPEIDMPGHARAAIRSIQIRYKKYMALNQPEKANEFLLNDWDDKSEYRSVQGWNDNVVNVGMESTYKFLEKITDEMVILFNEAGAPLTCIHTGGDEVPHGVWEKSPACRTLIENNSELKTNAHLASYFVDRFSTILAERNIVAAGWEEIALIHDGAIGPNPKFVGKNLRPYIWNNMWNSGNEGLGYKLANAGYKIVLAPVTNLYFDLAYNKNPNEPGSYWGSFVDTRKSWEYTPLDVIKCANNDHFGLPIDKAKISQQVEPLTDLGKVNVLGIQGLLWSENNLGLERMEYSLLPKMLGLAERAWAQNPEWALNSSDVESNALKQKAWNEFVNTLGQNDLPRLDYFNGGMGYRIPTPGAKIVEGMLYANVRFQGLDIRYTTDGTEPTTASQLYLNPIKVTGKVKLSTFSSNGCSSRSVEVQ